jgi:hypothetical protein
MTEFVRNGETLSSDFSNISPHRDDSMIPSFYKSAFTPHKPFSPNNGSS